MHFIILFKRYSYSMANTTFYKLVCGCGHEGKIRLRKNDTPYGNADWYSYMLIDFNGWPYRSESFDSPPPGISYPTGNVNVEVGSWGTRIKL